MPKKFPHKSLREHLDNFTPQDRFWLVVLGHATKMISENDAKTLLGEPCDLADMNQRFAFAIQALVDRLNTTGQTVVSDLAQMIRR